MKRLLMLVVFSIMANLVMAQLQVCSWHDGYWGEWKDKSWLYTMYGNYSGFVVYEKSNHPSKYVFKFQADSYRTADKKTIKYHIKNKEWYVYSGTVEYYVTEDYPTIDKILEKHEFPYFHCDSGYGRPCVKRTARATIKIAPYKKHPTCYNIYFDNVAVGIDLGTGQF